MKYQPWKVKCQVWKVKCQAWKHKCLSGKPVYLGEFLVRLHGSPLLLARKRGYTFEQPGEQVQQ